MSIVYKSDIIPLFNEFLLNFKKGQLWWAMVNIRENSPWHRESNVGVHTEMLIDWYMKNKSDHRSEHQRILTMMSCVFHDVGKPVCEQKRWSEARGAYTSYHGHELVSARMWIDYALSHRAEMESLRLTIQDISNIAFMIEYHLPFDIAKFGKKLHLKRAMMRRGGESGHQAWLDLLCSDQFGRIPDDPAATQQKMDVWLAKWEKVSW